VQLFGYHKSEQLKYFSIALHIRAEYFHDCDFVDRFVERRILRTLLLTFFFLRFIPLSSLILIAPHINDKINPRFALATQPYV
jgi:hypothetical protein